MENYPSPEVVPLTISHRLHNSEKHMTTSAGQDTFFYRGFLLYHLVPTHITHSAYIIDRQERMICNSLDDGGMMEELSWGRNESNGTRAVARLEAIIRDVFFVPQIDFLWYFP